jgi:hypothetical protein
MRLTPILVFLLLLTFFSSHHFRPAPYFFPKLGLEICEKYWWSQLVYAQNYVNFKQPVSGMISDEV